MNRQIFQVSKWNSVGIVVVIALVGPNSAQAQSAPGLRSPSVPPTAYAVERISAVDIDGVLEEEAWRVAPAASGFVQREPIEGALADQDTEVRILFDETAIYVGARMFDDRPHDIGMQLVRRDEFGQYDYFEVAFDPNRDRRTAYLFRVSASNVQGDEYLYEDNEEDDAWDAVWESAVQRDSLGWTAELRIPLSQMRYESSTEVQEWGVNFARRRLSANETTHFALMSRLQQGIVSQFGTLDGMQIHRASRLLEFLPYALSSAYTAPARAGDPFFDGSDLSTRVGVDVRYGLGAQFTLDATVNPDFGQVEADPAVINLTAFETRFDERRPFFVEDGQVFDFSLSAGQDLYYSRRIGRPPHGDAPDGAQYVDTPDAATIVAAAKVTGRTSGGLSVGALTAFTRQESGTAAFGDGSPDVRFPVEPRTGFGVVRLSQDFNDGTSTVGAISTMMSRDLPGDGRFDFLPSAAFTFGLDYEHQWADRTWAVYGYVAASHVRGDSTAMIRVQRSSNHYRQRPDSRTAALDSSATSLTGLDWRFTFAKRRGEHWTGALWLAQTTPGFEINDLGFSRRQEALDGGLRIGYREIQPGTVLRSYNASFSTFHNFSHGALDDAGSWDSWRRAHVSGSFNVEVDVEFLNYWQADVGFNFRPTRMDRNATRGGPLIVSPQSHSVSVGFETDQRGRLSVGPDLEYDWGLQDSGHNTSISFEVEYRPSTRLELEVAPEFSWSRNATQYVTQTDVIPNPATFGSRYLFGNLEQREFAVDLRMNLVFNPTMSLQLYAQPLMASGRFLDYRQLVEPESFDFDVLEEGVATTTPQGVVCMSGRTCVDGEDRLVDFDGDGAIDYTFGDRNFSVQSLVGNAVFRWEYRPGSTLFLVWQRLQEQESSFGDFDFGRDIDALFAAPSENVFMIKVNYWWGL